MAVSLQGSGGGRRRRVDAELNLVPYIDLLTCMVAFLLITAVWTQLARLEVAPTGEGPDDTMDAPRTKVVVLVGDGGFNLVVDDRRERFPRRGEGYDYAALATALGKVKAALPDKKDALIASEDAIRFEVLAGTMDAVLEAGFPAVSLVDAKGAGL
jgi:biopolymer transport protein ExbD